MNRVRFAAVAALLLIAAWLLLVQTETPPPVTAPSGYEVRGLKALRYDAQGGSFRLESRLATRAPGASSIHLTGLDFHARDRQGRRWQLRAEQGTLHEAKALLRMRGAVRVEQLDGNTALSADSMRMLWDESSYPKMVYAQGRPLRFTHPRAAGSILQGSGRRMEYEVAAGRIRLFGGAVLEREEDILRGERIEYLLEEASSPGS